MPITKYIPNGYESLKINDLVNVLPAFGKKSVEVRITEIEGDFARGKSIAPAFSDFHFSFNKDEDAWSSSGGGGLNRLGVAFRVLRLFHPVPEFPDRDEWMRVHPEVQKLFDAIDDLLERFENDTKMGD